MDKASTKKLYWLHAERVIQIPGKFMWFWNITHPEVEKRIIEVTADQYQLMKDLDVRKHGEWTLSGKTEYPEAEAMIDKLLEDE